MQAVPVVRHTVEDTLTVWFDDPTKEHLREGATACTG
jgi:hypothetical protein